MCIVSVAWQAHPRWKLIAIGNRDEMHARPSEPLARWEEPDHLLAGRDITAGGTWLGVSEKGRFAVVTNLSGSGPPSPERASRGDLLKDYLVGHGKYAHLDKAAFSEFNPFNLLTVDGSEARIHSSGPDPISTVLNPGVYALSNGTLDNPWPKSAYLDSALNNWLEHNANDPVVLLESLTDQTTYPPQSQTSSDQTSDLEPRHSGVFISNPLYGTRCSTVVAVGDHGDGMIIERRFGASGKPQGETHLSFRWPR